MVDDNVKLEVLDWGGTGRPLVLLAGLGNTAHVFDDFAPKLTPQLPRLWNYTARLWWLQHSSDRIHGGSAW